jgi:hypothetical protein
MTKGARAMVAAKVRELLKIISRQLTRAFGAANVIAPEHAVEPEHLGFVKCNVNVTFRSERFV